MSGHSPVTEVELKLAVPPGAAGKLGAHPLLRGRPRPLARKLYSVYFDTPELDLWRQGVTLRLRRAGGRWLQTVKSAGSARAGLHRRRELESEIAGPLPDFDRVRDGDLAGIFASPRLRSHLKPVFVTEFTRSSRILDLGPEVVVEAALDRGEIRSGDRAAPVSELELELRKGAAWHLYELALKLLDAVPLAVENRSKAERGFALARGECPEPVKARPALLSAGMTVSDALEAVMWASLAHLQANERGMLQDAGRRPEYLHQMRVALRRLRSAFDVFAPSLPEAACAPLVAELKWLAASLGPARDWDVFMMETLPFLRAESGEPVALAAFGEQCARLRGAASRRARRAVASKRYQRLVLSLAVWLSAQAWLDRMEAARRGGLAVAVGGFAGPALEARYGRVRRRGRRLAQLPSAELHRLRIAIKKFRYAADFFAGLYNGKKARAVLKGLTRLQGVLGAINDAATGVRLVAAGSRGTGGRRAAGAKGILLDWSRGRSAKLRRELKGAWKAFRAAGRFWQ